MGHQRYGLRNVAPEIPGDFRLQNDDTEQGTRIALPSSHPPPPTMDDDDDDFGADTDFLAALAESANVPPRIEQPKPQRIQQPTPQRLDRAPPSNIISTGPKIV
jgi:hypothetical protein